MYSFNLLKSERKFKFYIGGSICLMGKLGMVVKTVILTSETECLMPFHPYRFPFFKPFQLTTGLHKELHLHLFKLPHPEDELPGNYFITECFTYLCNPKGYLHPPGLLHIKKVDKDPLSGFGPEIDFICSLRSRSHLSGKHKVKLPYIGPVTGTGYRAHYFIIN